MRILACSVVAALAAWILLPAASLADNGNAPPTLSFFSGGDGARADWLATSDQPPGDTDNQAIELLTTNDAPTFSKGFAGILVHHVTGISAESFPDSSFWNRTPSPYFDEPYTLGSPRLVVEFQTPMGAPDGDAELDQAVRGNGWEQVSDVTDYPNSGWDVHTTTPTGQPGGPCPFLYHQKWAVAQSCHAGDVVSTVFLVADPYGIQHFIDDINVDGKTFSSASDNGGGNNDPAGPDATTDPTLLPPLIFPPL